MDVGVAFFLTDRSMAPDRLAIEAESRGYSSVYFPEHTHLPVRADTPPSLVEGVELDDYRRSLDPLVALGAAASVTTKIRLGTGVLLVAQHDPIVLSKQLATLDLISNGRVTLGIGFGWNAEEAADHGINFTERRQITREKMLCMQALWGEDPCEYHGALIDLQPCWASPKPVQDPRIRTLVGAAAGPGTFRAIGQYGDGWMPIGGAGMSIAIPELRR
ncbi:MAG TPA: TIGR03619 family F420-dependent LLM class oxidoreductase, partial [Acidimicrobiales bacterium]|nr:TIGR03619 family F420-dependent LLM class oxidoreductase [Acidimicrobiales bacterium]